MDDFHNPLDEAENPRAKMGNNNPPSKIDDARAAYKSLSEFLARVPAITDESTVAEAKLLDDRAQSTLKELEADRKKLADPLYAEWTAINARYKPARESLEKLAKELLARMMAYAKAEKAKREAEAAAAAKAAAEAERIAKEAEAAEREAIDNAKQGEFTDVGAATEKADQAFAEFETASRFAKRAEKDTTVRIGGGFGRARTLKTAKVLVVTDAAKAIEAIGLTDKIKEAILSGARDYRKTHDGALPAGVSEIEEDRI